MPREREVAAAGRRNAAVAGALPPFAAAPLAIARLSVDGACGHAGCAQAAMRCSPSVALLAFAAPALAQTYIVDVANGPGTHYTSIAAAVAAVGDGAVLRVRPGVYSAFAITNKSLKVLADPGVIVAHGTGGTAVTVSGVAASRSVVLSGLDVRPLAPNSLVRIRMDQCAGSVLLDRIWATSGSPLVLEATGCDRLLLRDVQAAGYLGCWFTGCNTVAERSTFGLGASGPVLGSAVIVAGGTLQLNACTVRALFATPPAPAHAVELQGAALRALGNTTLIGGLSTPAFAVGGTGTARVAPTVTLGTPSFGPGVAGTTLVMPAVATTSTGSQVTATVTGAPGHLVAVAMALPGPLVSLPGTDPIWLDGATFTPLGAGVLGTPAFVVQLPWTSGVVPAVRAVFQALTFDPATGFAISNPSFVLLP